MHQRCMFFVVLKDSPGFIFLSSNVCYYMRQLFIFTFLSGDLIVCLNTSGVLRDPSVQNGDQECSHLKALLEDELRA